MRSGFTLLRIKGLKEIHRLRSGELPPI
jgi:hypothetical protein